MATTTEIGPTLQVLALQAEQIRRQIDQLRYHAMVRLSPIGAELTTSYCRAADLLLGQVWAAFHNESKAAAALTDQDREQAAEAAGRA
jgi:hypothetical protein